MDEEAKPVNCPKCRVELLDLVLLNVDIEVCPLCNGCWLDENELTQITRSRGQDAVALTTLIEPAHTQFRCPRCKGVLEEGHHPKDQRFLIDRCIECQGLWLDRGELTRLIARPDPSEHRSTP